MNAYTLYWRDGSRNVVHGSDPANAMNLAGFGAGSLPALDFYANGEDASYAWDTAEKSWRRIPTEQTGATADA